MFLPGMYFLVECSNGGCEHFSKLLPSYIGSCGKFDIFHTIKYLKCGSCFNNIVLVDSIMFASCIWGYRGLIRNEKKVTTEIDRKAHKIEFFDHKKGVVWDWLVVNLKPLQHQLLFDVKNSNESLKNYSDVIEEMINQFSLASQTSKYQKRYEKIPKEEPIAALKYED